MRIFSLVAIYLCTLTACTYYRDTTTDISVSNHRSDTLDSIRILVYTSKDGYYMRGGKMPPSSSQSLVLDHEKIPSTSGQITVRAFRKDTLVMDSIFERFNVLADLPKSYDITLSRYNITIRKERD